MIGIDPGTTHSGWVITDERGEPIESGVWPNDDVFEMIGLHRSEPVSIEMISSYGMAVGAEVFETCVWVGRFMQFAGPERVRLIYRRDVKLHLCNSTKAKDPNVRVALLDRFGGKEKAIGKKATQGPLYGIKSHAWAALGVAVTALETKPAAEALKAMGGV